MKVYKVKLHVYSRKEIYPVLFYYLKLLFTRTRRTGRPGCSWVRRRLRMNRIHRYREYPGIEQVKGVPRDRTGIGSTQE